MKKALSLLLALLLCAAVIPASLGESAAIDLPDMGMSIPSLASVDQSVYYAGRTKTSVITRDPYIAAFSVVAFALPRSYVNEENPSDSLAEAIQYAASLGACPLAHVFVTGGTAEELKSILGVGNDVELTQIGESGGYTFYLRLFPSDDLLAAYDDVSGMYPDAFPASARADLEADISKITEALPGELKAAAFSEPQDPMNALLGAALAFETTDLDGNTVSSADLFAANKYTMINFWGTWCGYCLNEMPEMDGIHQRMKEKGCGIIGVEYEQYQPWTDELISAGKEVLEKNGITYPSVKWPEGNDLMDTICSGGFPTSIFVDSEGKIACFPIVGAQVSEYEKTLDQLLANESKAQEQPAASAPLAAGAFQVRVTDENGPVKDVAVQFCSQDVCNVGKTDENGIASFNMPEGVEYEIHILKAPEGYAPEQELYKTQTTYGTVEILLKKTGSAN